MTNGVMNLGTKPTGGLDLWSFTAVPGQSIVLRMGQITSTNSFNTLLRLYDPSGALVGSDAYGGISVEVATRATNGGTFLVVASDGNVTLSGSGDYRLTLAKTGDPVVISPGQQGGPLTNGLENLGTIPTGGLDVWTLTAIPGQAIILRMGQITTTNSFNTLLRLYDPSGALLGTGYYGGISVEVATRATNGGTFLVLASDGNVTLSGSGDYRLTLAQTGPALQVPPGEDGGRLTAGVNPAGTITAGDLEAYSFTTCKGETVGLQVKKLTDNGGFTPWLRVYGPSGLLLGSAAGSTVAQLTIVATNSGAFLATVSDGNVTLSGSGTYQLTSNGLSDELRLCNPLVAGSNLDVSGIGGTSNALFILYSTTNITTPAALWSPIMTNRFDSFGVFDYFSLFDRSQPPEFFRFLVP